MIVRVGLWGPGAIPSAADQSNAVVDLTQASFEKKANTNGNMESEKCTRCQNWGRVPEKAYRC